MKLEDLTAEQQEKISEFGLNTWYVLELLGEYKKDPDSVSDNWKELFKDLNLNSNGNKTATTSNKQVSSSGNNNSNSNISLK
jgi:2-oxoglutarate dehydrogenase complex dehydrogenase (E1) component-like enzyme